MLADQIPVWLDCDPGHDDAFAILLATYHPRIKLLGISTVFGNASLERTTYNAASILTAIGKANEVPLYYGLGKASERPAIHAPTDIHGESGLDGTALLPSPQCNPSSIPAVDAMAMALKLQPPGSAWIVATGALTNVHAALRKYPELVPHIRGLSFMGGSLGGGFSDAPLGRVDDRERIGNITLHAEFNVFADPEAAAAIVGDRELAKKTTMVPLDLSHQVLATEQVRTLLLHGRGSNTSGPGKTKLRTMLVELLYFFARQYSEVFGIKPGPPLHDPIAVAAVLIGSPDEIYFAEWDASKSTNPAHAERFSVTIETTGTFEEAKRGELQTGRTIAKALPAGQTGIRIPRRLDVDRFWEVMEECMERADAVNFAQLNPHVDYRS